jgi:pyruvate/2-oxoglutarate dehydrogenase complex dihydrolipoamide acyltransferase (E2) component
VLHAPRDGVIEEVAVKQGEQVAQGALIAALAEEANDGGAKKAR